MAFSGKTSKNICFNFQPYINFGLHVFIVVVTFLLFFHFVAISGIHSAGRFCQPIRFGPFDSEEKPEVERKQEELRGEAISIKMFVIQI